MLDNCREGADLQTRTQQPKKLPVTGQRTDKLRLTAGEGFTLLTSMTLMLKTLQCAQRQAQHQPNLWKGTHIAAAFMVASAKTVETCLTQQHVCRRREISGGAQQRLVHKQNSWSSAASILMGKTGASWACIWMAHNAQWSGAVGRLKPRFRFFMAASEPAMLSFILSVAVAVAALARAAAVLAPNLQARRDI